MHLINSNHFNMKTKFNGILTLLLALSVQFVFAQKTVSGTVTDEAGPLPGVNILIKGTTTGTDTDFDGNYSIQAKQGDVLMFSYVGMETVEKVVGASNRIDVVMTGSNVLDEVVVVAYGSQNKETITSSVAVVNSEDIESRPTASVVQALQSKAPGLNISTGNGQPGANSVVLLRGINSINGNVEPLFVMDGVPIDEDNFRSINQSDIENVTILKDASATAIYGNRATGGVILITTKKGKRNEKLQVKYSSRVGFTSKPNPNFTLADSKELLSLEREVGVAAGSGSVNSYLSEVLGITNGVELTDDDINRLSNTNTDWTKILLRTGITYSHDLSFSFGNDKTTSFTSLGYMNQEGISLRSKLHRINFRNNTTYTNGKFRLTTKISTGFSKSDIAGGIGTGTTGSGSLSNPFIVPFVGKPYLSPYNEDGTLNIVGNSNYDDADGFLNTPFIALNVANYDTNKENEIKVIGGINASYDLLENLTATAVFGVDYTDVTGKYIEPTNSIRGSHRNDKNAEFQGFQFESSDKDSRFNLSAQLDYDKTIGEVHNFNFTALTEFLYAQYSGFSYNQTGLIPGLEGTGAGFIPGTTVEDPNEDGIDDYFYIPTLGSFKLNVSQLSYLGKLSYDYDRITGVDFTIRRDASSRFNTTNKWGTFWAVGAFLNLTKSIIDESKVFNNLKLRGSYGITGNDRVSDAYYGGLVIPYDLFNTGTGYNGSVGLFPSQIGNPNLKWEKTTKANVGVDFSMIDNRLSGSFDVYKNKTDDVFISRPNTGISGGFTSISDNVGSLQNTGIEASLDYKIVKTNDVLWSIGVNGSYNENEITSLPGTQENQYGEIILDASQRAPESVGHPYNSFYAVRWVGVNPANGNPLYLDRDGNVTEEYSLDNRVFLDKSSVPKYQGGFNTAFSYKNFSIDASFSFAAEVYRYNGTLGVIEDPSLISIANVSEEMLTAWREPGDITSIPSLNTGSVRNLLTDRYLEDSSYLRLKNLAFGYDFNSEIFSDNKIQSIRVYVQGENLLTWTKWRGFDPEFDPYAVNDFFTYPNSRIVTLGVDIKF